MDISKQLQVYNIRNHMSTGQHIATAKGEVFIYSEYTLSAVYTEIRRSQPPLPKVNSVYTLAKLETQTSALDKKVWCILEHIKTSWNRVSKWTIQILASHGALKKNHSTLLPRTVHDIIKSVILSNHPFSNRWIETLKGGRSSSRYNTVSEMFSFFLKCI